MAALRQIVTGISSATYEEARLKSIDFFREVCRALPSIIHRFNLYEVITLNELRSRVNQEFRKHEGVKNPKVIDMLVYKGQEEFENYMTHSKQRHHILSQWILGPVKLTEKPGFVSHRAGIVTGSGESEFLQKFYESNDN